MTKGELMRALTGLSDEIELLVDIGEDELKPVHSAKYHWPPGETAFVRLRIAYELDPDTMLPGTDAKGGADG